MDKIKINNQVVLMRKFVKQAKTHTINKCTKHIKFLENRKGNEEQMAKTKRKLQRLLEEVKILKKIQPDLVSKLALAKEKDWKAILAEKNVPLEDRCLALLANHPPVQKSVEKFLDDNNELVPKIPELVKEWEDKKEKRSLIKNRKSKQNTANDPNTLPLGNKNVLQPSKVEVKSQSFESSKSISVHLDTKNSQNTLSNQKLKRQKLAKREVSSDEAFDELVPTNVSSPDDKNSLPTSGSESDESDNFDLVNDLITQTERKFQVTNKTKNDQSSKISKPSKVSILNSGSNIYPKKYIAKEESMYNSIRKTAVESDKEENFGKLQDIRSKLLEISKSKAKDQNNLKRKSAILRKPDAQADSTDESLSDECEKMNKNISCVKAKSSLSVMPAVKNKTKAITILDLNELQDVEEFPIKKSDSDTESETDEDSGKQKKDPFFLRDGEPVSESDDDENETRKKGFNSFKKNTFDSFSKKEQRNGSFENRKFDNHSVNRKKSNFSEGRFTKKEPYFKDNKRNFKQAFNDSSEQRQIKSFKFSSKDKFSKNFTKNPKEKNFRQNQSKDSKWKSNSSNSNKNNSVPKNKSDDKPLHPSWEAKRKLKEAANTKFQGKRMVFT